MDQKFENSDHWGQTTPENFESLVPAAAWISRQECEAIIGFFKMPIRLFDVGQDAMWQSWVDESLQGVPKSLLRGLRGPGGEGYQFGCLAPFLAWGWVWHGQYVTTTGFLALLGSMHHNTAMIEEVTESDPLLGHVLDLVEVPGLVSRICTLWVGASLCLAGHLRRETFTNSNLWQHSPLINEFLKTTFTLDGPPKISSITESERRNARGFLDALQRDIPWILACVLIYRLCDHTMGCQRENAFKQLVQALKGKTFAFATLEAMVLEQNL